MAFLRRVVNGDGTLEREYAIGRGRMDLCLRYGAMTLGIELKVWRDGEPDPLAEGLEQLDGYLAGLGLESGWQVIFDRPSGQPPIRERTSSEQKREIAPLLRPAVYVIEIELLRRALDVTVDEDLLDGRTVR